MIWYSSDQTTNFWFYQSELSKIIRPIKTRFTSIVVCCFVRNYLIALKMKDSFFQNWLLARKKISKFPFEGVHRQRRQVDLFWPPTLLHWQFLPCTNWHLWILLINVVCGRPLKSVYLKENLGIQYCKVHIFWEGHKILRNLNLTLVQCSASQK